MSVQSPYTPPWSIPAFGLIKGVLLLWVVYWQWNYEFKESLMEAIGHVKLITLQHTGKEIDAFPCQRSCPVIYCFFWTLMQGGNKLQIVKHNSRIYTMEPMIVVAIINACSQVLIVSIKGPSTNYAYKSLCVHGARFICL